MQYSVSYSDTVNSFSYADAPICYGSVNYHGAIIEKENALDDYFSAKECCVETDSGNSFSTGGECIVRECIGIMQVHIILLLLTTLLHA